MFFKPADGWIGDIIPIYHNGRFYIYYLKDYRTPDHAHLWDKNCWALMETEDFVHFTPEKLLAVPAGTGDVFYHDGKWHLLSATSST
jgi:beta-fructofuranosidase